MRGVAAEAPHIDEQRVRQIGFREVDEVAVDEPDPLVLERLQLQFELVRLPEVIAVEKCDERGARLANGKVPCGRKADAEDIAQEVCVRLGKAIRDYRGGGAFTTWLYSVTMNAARDMMRKTTRENVKTEAYGAFSMISGEASAGVAAPAFGCES